MQTNNVYVILDTYQNSNRNIKLINVKVRIVDDWYIHMVDDVNPEDKTAIVELYTTIPKSTWLDLYINQPEFDMSAFLKERYKPTFLDYQEMLDVLLENKNIYLLDLGEATRAFAKYVGKAPVDYAVKHLSYSELSDERNYVLLKEYTKTELNEIKQRIDSLCNKLVELELKYGDSIRTTQYYQTLCKLVCPK